MKARHHMTALLLPILVMACESNPTIVEELAVELTLSSSHVHILSEITFTVTVKNQFGDHVTDFDTLRVEQRSEGSETWRSIALTPSGEEYSGTYTFASSGHYDLRVSGMRDGGEMMVLHEMHDPIHVLRAHAEAGGYRIEFESFPGHMHEGEQVTLKFWIMEAEADANGDRAPISGLAANIRCTEDDGSSDLYVADEGESGVYEATHVVGEAGDFHGAILFTGIDGADAEAEFEAHVAHGH